MATPDRLGDFEIVEEIGRGGFGIVYRARQVSLDRAVALKVLYRHLIHTEDQLSRFEREAHAAARLDHPAIVSVYAWGAAGEDFFIAQRLVGNGRTLADEIAGLKTAGTPPKGHFRRAAEWLAAVAEGLQQAHERGIVHRDVKPSNILLDEAGRPCLGDFGLAKVEDGLELSRTGDFAGSPYFMSPEQADSRRGSVDHRTDIYSLGVTLYELLTLTPPFQGQTAHEIIRRILTEEPKRPMKIEPRVPQDLETICLKAMEKDPGRRYQSAQELADDLQAFLDGEPIAAVPIGGTRRALRLVRRHREAVAFVLLGSIVVIGGLYAGKSLQDKSVEAARSAGQAQLSQDQAKMLGQSQQDLAQRIHKAAESQDPQAVTSLVAQQQQVTQVLNENYTWLSEQLSSIGDSDSIKQVAAGVATGGLVGGLEGLQQVLVGKKAATKRDELLSDLARRLNQVKANLRSESGEPAAAPFNTAHGTVRAAFPFGTRLVSIDGTLYLVIGSQGWPLLSGAKGATEDTGASGDAAASKPAGSAQAVIGGVNIPRSAPVTGGGMQASGGLFSPR